MPLKGILTTGKSCRIVIDSAPTMPGVSAAAIVWIPQPGAAGLTPDIAAVAPGMRVQKTVPVPDAQMLIVDVDVAADLVSSVTISVEEDGQVVASGHEIKDTEWTFLVVP